MKKELETVTDSELVELYVDACAKVKEYISLRNELGAERTYRNLKNNAREFVDLMIKQGMSKEDAIEKAESVYGWVKI